LAGNAGVADEGLGEFDGLAHASVVAFCYFDARPPWSRYGADRVWGGGLKDKTLWFPKDPQGFLSRGDRI
jgi:hypothetical protein